VTGQALKEVLAQKIFQPLGLTHTFWPETNYLPQPYHHSYTDLLGAPNYDVTYYGNSWGNAAGILISNIEDLKIWAKELALGDLLSAESKNERILLGVQDSGYGFGLEIHGNLRGHSGGIVGWNTMVFHDAVKKITIITHANSLDEKPASFAFSEFAKVLGY
jgi:D-alanyl-D-alanine carboxypeptidase